MKFNVVKRFVDKYTLEFREKGAIVEYSGARAEELRTGGYIERIEPTKRNE